MAAAREAGYANAHKNASNIYRKVEPYILRLIAQVEKEIVLDQARVIREMEPVALWTIDDYIEVVREEGKPPAIRWKPFDELTREQRKAVKKVEVDDQGNFRYEFHEKMPTLMAAGKHLGMFNERLIVQQRTVHEHRLDLSGVPTDLLREMEQKLLAYTGGVIEGESRRVQ